MTASVATRVQDPCRAHAERAIAYLARAMKNMAFFEVRHPIITEVLAQVVAELSSLLAHQLELSIRMVNGYVVIDGRPIVSPNVSLDNLVGACQRRGVGVIVFRRGVTAKDMEHLSVLLTSDPADLPKAGGVGEGLAALGVRRISVERLQAKSARENWRATHAAILDVLRGAGASVRTGQRIDMGSVQHSVRSIVSNVLGAGSLLHNLNCMKEMDEYTFVHALHCCILGLEFGRHMGLPREQLEELGTCMLLHDVGKIFVPLEILRKPSGLDEGEFAVMARHPIDGAAALAREQGLPEAAPVVAFEHHMLADHSGYPKVSAPRPLLFYSLVTSLTDVYDALTSVRPYRPPLPPTRAIELMREHYGDRLDPRLLRCFLAMLGPYPTGSVLRLSHHRLAVVTAPNRAEPERPLARRLELGEDGRWALAEEAPLTELVTDPGAVEIVDPVELGIDPAMLTRIHDREPARG